MRSNTRYQWDLLPRLAMHIERGYGDKAHRELKELLETVNLQSEANLMLSKMRCAQIMSTCMRAARLGGASSTNLLNEHFFELAQLSRLQTWTACKRRMHRYVDLLLGQIDDDESDRMHRIIASICEELCSSIQSARSLSQYAQELELSEGHLSRSFSEIRGRSFSEEIRLIRIQKAKHLLIETDNSVQSIAESLGVASPSQFIADFRHETGMTPGQYRKA